MMNDDECTSIQQTARRSNFAQSACEVMSAATSSSSPLLIVPRPTTTAPTKPCVRPTVTYIAVIGTTRAPFESRRVSLRCSENCQTHHIILHHIYRVSTPSTWPLPISVIVSIVSIVSRASFVYGSCRHTLLNFQGCSPE